ncbi:MAG: MarR family transcriptional regulator [Desulforhopalus sp.]|nr:MarR family transcriptional regulator [Desulforhopalus sp.]
MNENLCYKLNYLSRLLLSQLNNQIKPYGVTQGQLPVLCCLDEDDGQTQVELCKNVQVEQPTMANTLRRMERDGLIYRTSSEHDRRQSRVFITEPTRPTVEILKKKRDEVVARMTQHMSEKELETFNRLLDVATQTLEQTEPDESKMEK